MLSERRVARVENAGHWVHHDQLMALLSPQNVSLRMTEMASAVTVWRKSLVWQAIALDVVDQNVPNHGAGILKGNCITKSHCGVTADETIGSKLVNPLRINASGCVVNYRVLVTRGSEDRFP